VTSGVGVCSQAGKSYLKVLRLLILFFIVLLLHVSSLTAYGRHTEPYCGNGQSLRFIGHGGDLRCIGGLIKAGIALIFLYIRFNFEGSWLSWLTFRACICSPYSHSFYYLCAGHYFSFHISSSSSFQLALCFLFYFKEDVEWLYLYVKASKDVNMCRHYPSKCSVFNYLQKVEP